MYRWLPLGTIVNNRVLVVHGGVSDSTDLDLIRSLDRGKVNVTITIIIVVLSVRLIEGKEKKYVIGSRSAITAPTFCCIVALLMDFGRL